MLHTTLVFQSSRGPEVPKSLVSIGDSIYTTSPMVLLKLCLIQSSKRCRGITTTQSHFSPCIPMLQATINNTARHRDMSPWERVMDGWEEGYCPGVHSRIKPSWRELWSSLDRVWMGLR